MSQQWYYAQGGQQHGPVALQAITALAAAGQIGPDDLVWRKGTREWVKASTVSGLVFPGQDESAEGGSRSDSPAELAEDAKDLAKRAASVGKEAVSDSLHRASHAAKEQAAELRLTFGSALRVVAKNASSAAAALFAHPLQISFYTITFLVAASMSIAGVVSAILLPMFIMGYLVIIRQHLAKKTVDLAEFIGFMRHGWDSLWHLGMLLASFFVTIGVMVAPFIIASVLLFYCLGTVGVVVTSGPRTESGSAGEVNVPDSADWEFEYESGGSGIDDDSSPGWLFSLFDSAVLSVLTIAVPVFCAILLAPICAALALFFYLVFDVSGNVSSDGKFDLVYESLRRTLLVGRTRSAELLLSGLLLGVLFLGFPVLISILGGLSERILAPGLASWLVFVLSSLGFLATVIYANLFVANMCIELEKRVREALNR